MFILHYLIKCVDGFYMLFSVDKGKNRKNSNNKKNDQFNNRGKKVCASNDESNTQAQNVEGADQGQCVGATASASNVAVTEVGETNEGLVSEVQQSSALESVYIQQGARPKSRTQSKVVLQSIKSHSNLPIGLVKRTTDVSKTEEECSIPLQDSEKLVSATILQTNSGQFGVCESKKESVMQSVECNQTVLESGGHRSSCVLKKLKVMHFKLIYILLCQLFEKEGNVLVIKDKYNKVFSEITSHAYMIEPLIKSSILLHYFLIFSVYKAGKMMITRCLSSIDFYAVDMILCMLFDSICDNELNASACQKEILGIYHMMQCDDDKPNFYSIKFYKVILELFRDLIYARGNRYFDMVEIQAVNLLIISVGIQISLLGRSVYVHCCETGTDYQCCRSVILRFLHKVYMAIAHMYDNTATYPLIYICNMPFPKIVCEVCSPGFDSEFSKFVEKNQQKGKFGIICKSIVDNICNVAMVEGFESIYAMLNIYENMVYEIPGVYGHMLDYEDQQEQEQESESEDEELCKGAGYGR
ncbi:hypothetical protein FDZ62_04595 [Ehrlichia ruminantium]|nr:hypothetical protein FDZ62_04595 [Ehrlichia ruminantium]